MLQKRMAHPLNMQNSRLEPLEIRLEKRIWALVCCQRDSLAKLKISVQVKEEKYCIQMSQMLPHWLEQSQICQCLSARMEEQMWWLFLKRKSAKLQSSQLNFNPWKSTEENNQTICKHLKENKVVTDNMDCQKQTVSNQSDLPVRQGNWPCGQGKSSRWFDFTSLLTLPCVTFFITQGNIVQMKLLQN